MKGDKDIPVRVALRCRPLVPKELNEGCQQILQFIPNEPQVLIGKDKSFTYDFAFGPHVQQQHVYEKSVAPLVKGIFKGYNATVLAYGQTGSGKTYTMGSCYNDNLTQDSDLLGVIPRVVQALFNGIETRKESDFVVRVSFLEIYNEELRDLLSVKNDPKDQGLALREDTNGEIMVAGLTDIIVTSPDETVKCLEQGSLHRTTGATAMNSVSSRSHAIFTISVEQSKREDSNDVCKSKFHLVDLAGSERAKRTQAEGSRFKEGVNINLGLLALGNVISALGDDSQKRSHVPYRDSKLTRLLTDSLGGNSHTVMIACVSPADSNMEETINTLRYADRARKIKNKPIVNRDPQAAEILRLKALVQQFQAQLLQNGGSANAGFKEGCADFSELLERNKQLEEENGKLTKELQSAVEQTTSLCEKVIVAEMARDKLKAKLEELRRKTGLYADSLNITPDMENNPQLMEQVGLMKEIQERINELDEEAEQEELFDKEESADSEKTDNTADGSPESKTFMSKHALRQAEMGRQLQELNKMLEKKQQLANTMMNNDGKMAELRQEYESNMKELELEVNVLQKEKEELQLQLGKSSVNSNKISEQRRQRLKELESQLSQLKKKITEQNKIIKMKEQSDKNVEKLNTEIRSMKEQRVKLMKQMKKDGEDFRKWKQQKDKEVMQLKAKDRKRQIEVVKLERQHERTKQVLRRKAEEAAAANRRLKDALDKQKKVLEDRGKAQERQEMSGIGQRVKKWLSQELEVNVSIKNAQHHLEAQIQDRKELTAQIAALKEKLDVPPRKKMAWTADKQTDTDDEREEIRKQIKALEQDVELRNVQITDLQQKLMDAQDSGKTKSRWESIHTMVEAKCALKYLMQEAAAAKSSAYVTQCNLETAESNYDHVLSQMEKQQQELKEMNSQRQEESLMLQRQHEEKVLFLLRQVNSKKDDQNNISLDDETKQRLRFQEEEISRLSELHDELQKKSEECDKLRRDLTLSAYHKRTMSLLPTITREDGSPFTTPKLPPPKKVKKKKETVVEDLFEEISDDETDDDDDAFGDEDEDYVPTPMRRKEQKKKVSSCDLKKRASMDGCGCKKACSTRLCSCRKVDNKCGEACRCDPDICKNKDGESPDSTVNESDAENNEVSSLNATFNLGRMETPTEPENDSTFVVDSSDRKVLAEMKNGKPPRKSGEKHKRDSDEVFQKPSPEINPSSLDGALKKKRKLINLTGSSSFFSPLS